MISSISWFEITIIVVSVSKKYFWVPASAADPAAVNLNGIFSYHFKLIFC